MMINVPIQISRSDSAVLASKALQLYQAFIKTAVETLGDDWIVVAPDDDRVLHCYPRKSLAGGSNGSGGPTQIMLPLG